MTAVTVITGASSGIGLTTAKRAAAGGAKVVLAARDEPSLRQVIKACLQIDGHAVIDADHSAIAERWRRAVDCKPIEFPFCIARLKKLLRLHFEHETSLMLQAGGALCACHRREHDELLELCDCAAALGENHWRKAQSLLRNKFPKLVRSHIACMDQIAVLFINTNQRPPQCHFGWHC